MREHLASENAHEFDRTIATFEHPRYELVATGDVYDGEEAVRGYFAESRRAFPTSATSSSRPGHCRPRTGAPRVAHSVVTAGRNVGLRALLTPPPSRWYLVALLALTVVVAQLFVAARWQEPRRAGRAEGVRSRSATGQAK